MLIEPVEPDGAPAVVQRIYEALESAGRLEPGQDARSQARRVARLQPALGRDLGGECAVDQAQGARLPAGLDPQRVHPLNSRPHRFGKRRGLTEKQISALKEPGGTRCDVLSAEELAVLRLTDLLTP